MHEIGERTARGEVRIMVSSVTKALVVGATFFGGILAGVTANRSLVQMPAWEEIGLIPWANFTRAENAGVGAIFYPVLGLLAILFTFAAAAAFRFDRATSGWPRRAIYSSALLTVAWAVVTRALLVPAMFSIRTARNDVVKLQQIFLTVERWSAVNDVLHVHTFSLNLLALAAALSVPKTTWQPSSVSSRNKLPNPQVPAP